LKLLCLGFLKSGACKEEHLLFSVHVASVVLWQWYLKQIGCWLNQNFSASVRSNPSRMPECKTDFDREAPASNVKFHYGEPSQEPPGFVLAMDADRVLL
jgi:hypothetical protein